MAVLAVVSGGLAAVLWLHHRRFLAYHHHKGVPAPPIGRAARSAELWSIATLGWWHVRGFLRDGMHQPSPPTGRPVVCIHGWTQNATNFWGLRRALHAVGRPTVGISMWVRFTPLTWYRWRLVRRLRRLASQLPDGFDVVCHSMGGVVFRMALAAHPDLCDRLHTVVTLGSPHCGTAATRGIPLVPELRAMRRSSPLLRDLPHLPALCPGVRVVTIAGSTDTIVYPISSAIVSGTEAIVIDHIGHAGLLTSPSAWAAVCGALDA